MSTSTDNKGLFNGKGVTPDGIGSADAQALEQLANQFFKAAPGSDPVAAYSNQEDKAGSGGVSPLAIQRGESFDIKDPQSSLPDPHFEDGKVPTAVAGSGRSMAITDHAHSLSGTSTNSAVRSEGYEFSGGIKEALDRISSFSAVPQIPVNDAKGAVYYFLQEANSWRAKASTLPSARDLTTHVNGHLGLTKPPFDVAAIRKDFPILSELVNGRPLIWLDNAATTQKPQAVIDRISSFYSHENSNIHRAAHELAARATDAYEGARKKVQQFLNAASVNEIVFVRGATEAINLVAKSWGEQFLGPGDEIIISHLEHHANIVPWQQLAEKKGCKLRVIPVDEDGQILLNEYAKLLNGRTRLVAVTQVSNALGTITPVKQIADMAHAAGAKVLIDGAQSVSHMPVNVQDIKADWFVFSGHKLFAPTGIGVLYGKEALLNESQPWQGGGNMIKDVTFEHTQYHNAPGRFEAGTGNIADAVGLGAAIDYVTTIGLDLIGAYEHYLLVYATRLLKNLPGLRLIGTAPDKASVLSFVLDGFTNDQVGQALNKEGIAVRTGHHCAQPILRRFGLESSVRPSLAFYNTCAEIDTLVSVLYRLRGSR